MTFPLSPLQLKNNEPVKILNGWKKGVPLSAKRLNEYVSAINRGTKHIQPPLQATVKPRNRLLVERFRFLGDDKGDFIICQALDEISVTEGNIRIAKPFLLRRTPFDNDSRIAGGEKITYVYSSSSERVATNTDGTDETQVIVSSYSEGDFILAIHGIEDQTGVRVDDKDLGWLDVNNDARAWAKKAD